MEKAVLPQPKMPDRLTDDPEFAPPALPSEVAAVRNYVKETGPAPALVRPSSGSQSPAVSPNFTSRERLIGTAAIVTWIAGLTTAAIIRQVRRNRSAS